MVICRIVVVHWYSTGGGRSEDASDSLSFGINPLLTQKVSTRVYSARQEPLLDGWIQGTSAKPTINFDCYFVPDLPKSCTIPAQIGTDMEAVDKFDRITEKYEKRWTKYWERFGHAYNAW
jgi:hypothetical protein